MLRPLRAIGACCAACLGLATGMAQAEPTWYQLELIVFARHSAADLAAEVWQIDPGRPDLERALELTEGGFAETEGLNFPYRRLGGSDLNLKPIAKKLRRSKQFRVLVHEAWQQPGFGNKQSRPVHISSAVANQAVTAARSQTAGVYASTFIAVENRPELDGWVRLSRARYLHLDVDLLLRAVDAPVEPVPPPTGSGVVATTADTATEMALAPERPVGYRMHQSRRMRSKEIHYIDHPTIGIIALATPVIRKPAPLIPPPAVPQTGSGSGSGSQTVADGVPKP